MNDTELNEVHKLGEILAESFAGTNKVYAPAVYNDLAASGTGDTWKEIAGQLFVLMATDKGQQRRECIWDDKLANIAFRRAHDMLNRNYFSHTDPDGNGPNFYARLHGYKLPGHYHTHHAANNIESIGLNYKTPETCWQGWLNSAGHRAHVLGEIDFYAQQTHIGMAFVAGTELINGHYGPRYWVVLSAPPMEN